MRYFLQAIAIIIAWIIDNKQNKHLGKGKRVVFFILNSIVFYAAILLLLALLSSIVS